MKEFMTFVPQEFCFRFAHGLDHCTVGGDHAELAVQDEHWMTNSLKDLLPTDLGPEVFIGWSVRWNRLLHPRFPG